MASEEKTFLLKAEGGLDAVSSDIELFELPGFAKRLINFQPTLFAGYEQISGFVKFGTSAPGGVVADKVTSVHGYFDGAICTKGGNIYFSLDGDSWVQVNKDSPTFVDEAALGALGALVRDTSTVEEYSYTSYHNGTELEMLICDSLGSNPIARLVIRDNAGVTEYKYIVSQAAEWPTSTIKFPRFIEVHNDRLVASGFTEDRTLLHYSALYSPLDFLGGGFIDNADEIVRVKGFRKNLMIFGRNKVSEVISLGSATSQVVQDVTRNIGCVSGNSIQEVGGDLVFLAPDGIRTIAGTTKLGDLELGTLSRSINPLLHELIVDLDQYTVCSTVIRNRSNYRIFFYKRGLVGGSTQGFGGVLKMGQQGPRWEWCEYKGLPCYAVNTAYISTGSEVSFHVSIDDYVYRHDTGDTFDGGGIPVIYETPEMSLGNPGFRKSLHSVQIYAKAPVSYQFSMKVSYDNFVDAFKDPPAYHLAEGIETAVNYGGSSLYGTAVYGGTQVPYKRILVEGSGKTFRIKIASSGSKKYSIQGMAITYFVNGRQ
jgi:hypothetical protein